MQYFVCLCGLVGRGVHFGVVFLFVGISFFIFGVLLFLFFYGGESECYCLSYKGFVVVLLLFWNSICLEKHGCLQLHLFFGSFSAAKTAFFDGVAQI